MKIAFIANKNHVLKEIPEDVVIANDYTDIVIILMKHAGKKEYSLTARIDYKREVRRRAKIYYGKNVISPQALFSDERFCKEMLEIKEIEFCTTDQVEQLIERELNNGGKK